MAARLREHYLKNVVPALTKEFGYKNIMAVPKVDKVSININGTQHTAAAGDAVDVGAFTCRVEVKSFDMFKVTLLTSCVPAKP